MLLPDPHGLHNSNLRQGRNFLHIQLRTMGEETTKPSGRKRGRPRTVTDDQEVPEVGQIPTLQVHMLIIINS